MTSDEFESQLEELESGEDFLDYFDVDYDPAIVHVNRLHILHRFHDYLEKIEKMPADAPWTTSRFELRDKVMASVPLGIRSKVLVEKGKVGEIVKVLREVPGGVCYQVHFRGCNTIQVPESALEPSQDQPLNREGQLWPRNGSWAAFPRRVNVHRAETLVSPDSCDRFEAVNCRF